MLRWNSILCSIQSFVLVAFANYSSYNLSTGVISWEIVSFTSLSLHVNLILLECYLEINNLLIRHGSNQSEDINLTMYPIRNAIFRTENNSPLDSMSSWFYPLVLYSSYLKIHSDPWISKIYIIWSHNCHIIIKAIM